MGLSLTAAGFDYVAYYNGAYENANSLQGLAGTGANSVELSLDYGIDPHTNQVYADPNYTDSLTALGAEIRQATGLGLLVMVRPLIDFVDPADMTGTPYSVGDWRSYYNPGPAGSAGANAFFASYQTMILQEAQVAVANGATSLSIGTELDQITGPSYQNYWNAIITALRTDDPSLKLTYSAEWDDALSPWQYGGTGLALGTGSLATQVSFASKLDSIGIDEYAPISDAANPTLAQLIAGWTQTPTDPSTHALTGNQSLIAYFESVAAQIGKPLLFTELGYESASDAASQPSGTSTNVFDPTLQANLYQAFFDAWEQAGNSSLTGVYFWNWDPNAAEVGPGNGPNFSPQGLPAQTIATEFFGSGGDVMTQYIVSAGHTSSGLTLNNGDTLTVLSGGTASSTTINNSGSEFVSSGGFDVSATINQGGQLTVGGSANGDFVSSGGAVVVSGGTATNIVLDRDGALYVEGGTASVTAAPGLTVASFSFLGQPVYFGVSARTVSSGITSGDVLSGGSLLNVVGSGAADNLQILSGGFVQLSSGGVESGATVSGAAPNGSFAGGAEFVYAGGSAVATVLDGPGGDQFISSGGLASGTIINGGGQLIESAGVASAAVIASGQQLVDSGGTSFGTTVLGGGQFVAGIASGTTVSNGGSQILLSGGTAVNTVIRTGGVEAVGALQTVSTYTIGTAIGTTISSGGSEAVFSGSIASNTTISSGGVLVLYGGASATGFSVAGGGILEIGSGYTDTMTQTSGGIRVLSGGTLLVGSGATAFNFVVSGGSHPLFGTGTTVPAGQLIVLSGGTASGIILATANVGGGIETISAGGVDVGATVFAGAVQNVFGSATSTVLSGGTQNVYSGATVSGTTGGVQNVFGTAVASFNGQQFIGSGGVTRAATDVSQSVGSSGTALGTVLGVNDTQSVVPGGIASGTIIGRGATEIVASAGTTVNTVISGGGLSIQNNAVVSGPITFAGSGGILGLGSFVTPSNTISGFLPGDTIALTGVPFDSSGSATLTSGNVLKVVENGVTHNLQLDPNQNFSGATFSAFAGGGGTEIGVSGSGLSASPLIEYTVPTAGSEPFSIASGPDGALWFTEVTGNNIGRISTSGTITEFPVAGNPGGIALGSDGALWFTEIGGNAIGRITTAGAVSTFAVPSASAVPHTIAAGPDGALWFTEVGTDKIGRITTGGTVSEFTVPTASAQPFDITVGPDGALWFTEFNSDQIGRITTSGAITEFTIPTANSDPAFITSGPDGALWFTQAGTDQIGRITTSGAVTEFTVPTPGVQPQGITVGPDGALWITGRINADQLIRLTTSGVFSTVTVPTAGSQPIDVTTGPDGNLWFTEFNASQVGELALSTSVSSLSANPVSGDFAAGAALSFTATFSRAVTVSGTPTLSLNDNAVATYDAAKSSSTALVFDYTVGAGQNTAALAATMINLPNGATITDGNGNNANLASAAATFSGLEIDTTAPTAVHNSGLSLGVGQTATMSASALQFTDNLSGDAQETYTLTTPPADGLLLDNEAAVTSFTQADIDNGLISYQETNTSATSDSFNFTVTDAAGNATAGQQFQLTIQAPPANPASTSGLRYIGAGNFGGADSDILWQSSVGTPTIWLMNGASATIATEATPPPAWQIAAVGDFNTDGQADILWQSTVEQPAIWLMNGTGVSNAAALSTIPPAGWNIVGAGDFYDTGFDDAILWQNVSGDPALWLMNGTTIVNSGALPNPGPSWTIIGAGDFWDTGHDNAILLQNSSGTVATWLMNGCTITAAATFSAPPAGWHVRGVGDFYNSGFDDGIVWQNDAGAVAIWRVAGGNLVNGFTLPSPGANWQVVGAGNFNGGGQSDILLANTGTGAAEIWFMNGAQVASTATVTDPPGAPLVIAAGMTDSAPTIGPEISELVQGGGTIITPTLAGGSLELALGAILNGAVTFASGGGTLIDEDGASDTVTGFSPGLDHLAFAGDTPQTQAAIIASAKTTNGNTTLIFPDHTALTLTGVTHVTTGIFA